MKRVDVLNWLKQRGEQRIIDEMSSRYGIVTKLDVLGVSIGTMLPLAKRLNKELDARQRHELAIELWDTGCYEAQMFATLVDDASLVTARQMDAWAATFDNWGIVDTACFKLFDQSPLASAKAEQWARSPKEFVKRAGYVMMACIALHVKSADEKLLGSFLPLIEKGAQDDRNFVKKGVNWALRSIGERSEKMNAAAIGVAERLAKSDNASAVWVGKDALRQLRSPAVQTRIAKKSKSIKKAPVKRKRTRARVG